MSDISSTTVYIRLIDLKMYFMIWSFHDQIKIKKYTKSICKGCRDHLLGVIVIKQRPGIS